MSDTIRFVRVRLFIAYSIIAWYSLYNPERGLLMLKDFNEADSKRNLAAVKERLFSRGRAASSKEVSASKILGDEG